MDYIMNKNLKNFALVFLISLSVLLLYQFTRMNKKIVQDVPYSKFLKLIESKKIHTTQDKLLTIQGDTIQGTYLDAKLKKEVNFKTYIAYADHNLVAFLKAKKVNFKGAPEEENVLWRSIAYIIPWVLIIGFFWFMFVRQLQSAGNRAFNFGKSRAKLNQSDPNKSITFKDVAGVDEAKAELQEVVEFLKFPKKFHKIGAKIPKGVLLVGLPGTGKTLLAKACAGEAKVPFFSISGSDFVEMFVGVGASRVRDLFAQARKQSPCVVFIDEIDAVGRLRGAGIGGGHDEREQTLNQLLVEMDGFEEKEGIILLAATNRPDVLDPALLRPGRFDRRVMVNTPDINGREAILKIHSKKVPLSSDVSLRKTAQGTPGFTGADLANLVNEAALMTASKDKLKVSKIELEDARDKVMMGPERKSFFITPQEKEIIAYHESGHSILSSLLPYAEPVHKVTIIPRGMALGITQQLPIEDKYMKTKNYYLDEIIVLLGGRLAEDIKFKDITTGASNDIERATGIAKKMITEWGMSSLIGPINLSSNGQSNTFIGKDYGKHTEHSEEYAKLIDREVQNIISSSLKKGRALLLKHRTALDKLACRLLEKESVVGDEVREIIFGKTTVARKTQKKVTMKSKSLSTAAKTKKIAKVPSNQPIIKKPKIQPA